jgi:hypothetical protein
MCDTKRKNINTIIVKLWLPVVLELGSSPVGTTSAYHK